MKSTKIMPPTWMLIAIIAMLILNFLFPIAWIVPPLWNLIGLLFLVSGMAMNLIADNAFKQARTTIKPFRESFSLVTNGVFQISRNPMYLGMALILTGIALLLRSLSPFLIIILFAILIDRTYIKVEERMLAKTFGAKWQAYKAKTRRWL
jgi:protein-S-isoprenylcysteine O-methyltransferase Ste14